MNRTLKEATVQAFDHPDAAALKAYVVAFVTAYKAAKHLKALRWRTPWQAVCEAWTRDPAKFRVNPRHFSPGTII